MESAAKKAASVRRNTGTPPSGHTSLSSPIRRLEPAATRMAVTEFSAGINAYGNVNLSLSSTLNANLIPPTASTAYTLNPNTTYTVFAVGDYVTATPASPLSLMVQ